MSTIRRHCTPRNVRLGDRVRGALRAQSNVSPARSYQVHQGSPVVLRRRTTRMDNLLTTFRLFCFGELGLISQESATMILVRYAATQVVALSQFKRNRELEGDSYPIPPVSHLLVRDRNSPLPLAVMNVAVPRAFASSRGLRPHSRSTRSVVQVLSPGPSLHRGD